MLIITVGHRTKFEKYLKGLLNESQAVEGLTLKVNEHLPDGSNSLFSYYVTIPQGKWIPWKESLEQTLLYVNENIPVNSFF